MEKIKLVFGSLVCAFLMNLVFSNSSFAAIRSTVNIDNFLFPRIGTVVNFPYVSDPMGELVLDGDYEINWISFYEVENGVVVSDHLNTGDAIEAGKTYRMTVDLRIHEDGVYFDGMDTVINWNGMQTTPDDYTMYTPYVGVAGIKFHYDFTPVEKIKLTPPTDVEYHATGYKTGYFTGNYEYDENGVPIFLEFLRDDNHWDDVMGGSWWPKPFQNSDEAPKTIKFRRMPFDYITYEASDIFEVEITRAEKPTGLLRIGPTDDSSTDGEIVNFDETMEYTNAVYTNPDEPDTTWYSVTGTGLTGLSEGGYYVRKKASGSVLASDFLKIALKAGESDEIPAPILLQNPEIENPETGDDLLSYVSLLVISSLGLVGSIFWFKLDYVLQ